MDADWNGITKRCAMFGRVTSRAIVGRGGGEGGGGNGEEAGLPDHFVVAIGIIITKHSIEFRLVKGKTYICTSRMDPRWDRRGQGSNQE